MNLRHALEAAAAAVCLLGCSPRAEIIDLKCENAVEPIAIETVSPRLSWAYSSGDFRQESFEVNITDALSGECLWTSGEVSSPISSVCVGGCDKFASFGEYCWQVSTKDHSGKTIVSKPSKFETAMLSQDDWVGQWISDGLGKDVDSAPMLRKSFTVGKDIAKARLYMSAAAYAALKLNGEKVTDALLEPGYTHYDKRNLYCVYDVTDKLTGGENVLSAVLGNGFYNEIRKVATWKFDTARWRDRARMLCELHISYKDGSTEVVSSDSSWKCADKGPYLSNNIYSGDIYDARLEIDGWEKPGFDDSACANAVVVNAPSPKLTAQIMPPIAPEATIEPIGVRSFGDSVYVFDFGKNIAGLTRLSFQGEAGTKISIEHGELLKPDGRVEMGNINIYFYPQEDYEIQKDIYYAKGSGEETWMPSFCYHGFRYAEVKTSLPIKDLKLEAVYFHTLAPSVGTFECSDTLANKIWDMTRRTYCNNFHSIITDCPTREKNGWTADNHLAVELGLLNFDGIAFYEKWVNDVVDNIRPDGRISGIIPDCDWGYDDWIGPVWDAAIFIIPNTLYNFTGDLSNVEKLWPTWNKYLEYLASREDEDGLVDYGIGDWLCYDTVTPTQFTTPVLYYFDYCTMARFAALMGLDPEPYSQKAQKIKEAVNAKWFDSENTTYANGSMTAQAAALYFGIVPSDMEQAVADKLAAKVETNDCFPDFGSMGCKTVLRMLTKYGHNDLAWNMASKTDCPSWGHWAKLGFTTLAETWKISPNFRDSSIDHVFFGDIAAWYVNGIVGINFDPAEPGFRHIILDPHFPEGLDWAKASYKAQTGLIEVSWQKKSSGVEYEFNIPANTSATLDGVTYYGGKHRIIIK